MKQRKLENQEVKKALETDQTIGITTIGRKSRKPHRIEIWFHNIGGEIYITGSPGLRDWYANLVGNSEFIFHLKQSVKADLHAIAKPITQEDDRKEVFQKLIEQSDYYGNDIDRLVNGSPLVLVLLKQ